MLHIMIMWYEELNRSYGRLQQETHCHSYSQQTTVGFPADSVPSTGWNINLWPGHLLSRSLFQTSATVRHSQSITYRGETTYKHTQALGCTHTHISLRLKYWRVCSESHIWHSSGLQFTMSQTSGHRRMITITELFQIFSTTVTVWVSAATSPH